MATPLPTAAYQEYADDVQIRALKQENAELRRWLSRGTHTVEDTRREREFMAQDLEKERAALKTMSARKERAVAERDDARNETAAAKQKLRQVEEQAAAFTHQLRRMDTQCIRFLSAMRDSGLSAETLLLMDYSLTTPSDPQPLQRPPLEAGREALLQLHQNMGALLVEVRQTVSGAALKRGASPEVRGDGMPIATSPRRAWETAAQRGGPEAPLPHLDSRSAASLAAQYADKENAALREKVLFLEAEQMRLRQSGNPVRRTSPARRML